MAKKKIAKNARPSKIDEGPVFEIPIEWHVSSDVPTKFANRMVVQFDKEEFHLLFFEHDVPLFIGSADEVEAALKETKTVRAECVAHIVVSKGRLGGFIEALAANYERSKQEIPESPNTPSKLAGNSKGR